MAGAKNKLPYAVSIARGGGKVRRYYCPRLSGHGSRERRPSLAAAAGAGHIAIGKAIIFPPGAPAAAVASDDFNEWDVVLLPRGDHGPH
jgi:hypothetical protein